MPPRSHRAPTTAATLGLTTAVALATALAPEAHAQPARPRSGASPVTMTPPRGDDAPPRIARAVEAVYPPEALRRGEGAVVRLLIDIDDGGHVTSVSVEEPSGQSGFDEAAVAAAREFEFVPARRGGRAVAARIRYRYVFTPPTPRAVDEDAPRPQATTATATTRGASVPVATPSPGGRAAGAPPRAAVAPVGPGGGEQGVTVYARAPSREIGRREFTAEEIRRIPGALGDALLAVQNLPGVARPQFGIGQFIVRSSAPEDSLVNLEGNPIVLPFHFGGFASTIATDLIERIEFLPGNFSARYGRVSGGVINVTLRAPSRDRVHFAADLDPIDLGVYASTPLWRGASIAIGARRSLIDLVGPLFFAGADGTSFRQWPFYYDGQIAFDWDITPRDSLRIVASGTNDQLILNFRDPNANDPNFRGNLGTNLAYAGVQARWRHRFGPDAVHTFAPALTYNYTFGQLGPEVQFRFTSINFNFRDELELHLSRAARLFVGIDSQLGDLDNDVRAPPIPTSGIMDPIDPSTVVTFRDPHHPFFNPAAYAEAEIDATPAVRILAGVRADYFSLLASRRGAATVTPRLSMRVQAHPRLALRAGFGYYSTPPRGYALVPGFGNPDLLPETWLHASAGFNLEIVPGVLDLDSNVFFKYGTGVVAPSPRLLPDGAPERFANTGLGRVIGGEWMLRIRPGRAAPLYGLISYTLQRAVRAACENERCPFLTYQYDQPHIFSGSLGAILPLGFEVGLRVRYTSGQVEPFVTGALFDADHDVSLTITDPTRTGRLPGFFTLDVRASKRFRVGPIRGQVILEVLNTLNSQNAESRIYSYDRRTSQLVYGLPIIPSLGVRAEY